MIGESPSCAQSIKESDLHDCKNYRRISLLPHACKTYERILESRLRGLLEHQLYESQFGFRPGRGTMDSIFTQCMIIGKSWEWKQHQYMRFFGLEKAADHIPVQKNIENAWKSYTASHQNSQGQWRIYAIRLTAQCVQKSEKEGGLKSGVSSSREIFYYFFWLFNLWTRWLDLNKVSLGHAQDEGGDPTTVLAYADHVALIPQSQEHQHAQDPWEHRTTRKC